MSSLPILGCRPVEGYPITSDLVKQIQSCTRDASLKTNHGEKVKESIKAVLKFRQDNPSVFGEVNRNEINRINGKGPHTERSIFICSSGEIYLLMTRCKSCGDRLLGGGADKKIKFAVNLASQKKAVVGTSNEEKLGIMKKELEFLKIFNGNSHIVQLLESGEGKTSKGAKRGYAILEYCDRGDLITEIEGEKIKDEDKKRWIQELLEALVAVHHAQVIHRDLKPDNILVYTGEDGKTHIKLADFGAAAYAYSKKLEPVGTATWLSPESAQALTTGSPIDFCSAAHFSSDVWTLGEVISYILIGQVFSFQQGCVKDRELSDLEVAFNLLKVSQKSLDILFSDLAEKFSFYRSFIPSMMKINPQERPAIETLLKELKASPEAFEEKRTLEQVIDPDLSRAKRHRAE